MPLPDPRKAKGQTEGRRDREKSAAGKRKERIDRSRQKESHNNNIQNRNEHKCEPGGNRDQVEQKEEEK